MDTLNKGGELKRSCQCGSHGAWSVGWSYANAERYPMSDMLSGGSEVDQTNK